jgi:hypothetical protein
MHLFKRKTEKVETKEKKRNKSIKMRSNKTNNNYIANMRAKEQMAHPMHRNQNITNSNFQGKLTLTRLLSFLNPHSEALREPAQVDLKTTLKATAAIGAIDVTALAIKVFTSIDITQFRKVLDLFKNKKTGISESYYVLIEACLTDIQVIMNYNKIKNIVENIDFENDLAIDFSKEFDLYTAIILSQFMKQFSIFMKTIRAYSYFLVNYNSVYYQIKKDFGFGLEEVIELFKEQLIIMQEICNRTNICLDQESQYIEYKKSSHIKNKLEAYLKGKDAANALENIDTNKILTISSRKPGEKIIFQ